jgi:flagellin
MPLSVNTNIASLTAQRSLSNSQSTLETAFERLSTGKRINSAVDDAAGLAISQTLTSKVNGLNQAVRNANDGISVVQIAEGALDEVTTILQRMRDLAVQASNDSLSSTERGYLDTEADKLEAALNDVSGAAKFGSTTLLSGSFAAGKTFQVGADSGDTMTITINTVDAATLTVEGADIVLNGTSGQAQAAITTIDAALNAVASDRATLGAVQSQLESTVRNLANVAENTAAARSRILDTDYAAETANLTKAQILQQASTAILAQANAQPQTVLSLLQ